MPEYEAKPPSGQGTKVVIIVVIVLAVLLVGCIFFAIVAAIAIPSLFRARISANEASAVGTMRSLVTTESMWRQTDPDRNDTADYWTADVSGFYRTEANPPTSGLGVAMIDVSVAQADDQKVANGAAVTGARIPGGKTVPAGLIALGLTTAKHGYFYRAMGSDEQKRPYAQDPDGNGQKFTNVEAFGFQARPETYDKAGINTLITNESGVIWGRDFGDAAPANADAWPGVNPAGQGWRAVQ